jgi:hypothetical protein
MTPGFDHACVLARLIDGCGGLKDRPLLLKLNIAKFKWIEVNAEIRLVGGLREGPFAGRVTGGIGLRFLFGLAMTKGGDRIRGIIPKLERNCER